jgi:ABC-2 type transport system ATP-binding protein
MAEAYLVAKDLYKSFNDHKAVNGVSFSIAKNEIFGLLGPNGAGKTTTIRMLSTVLIPDAGEVTVGGFSTRQQSDKVRSLIGVCPQELALYEELTALDNLTFFGRLVGLDGKSKAQLNLTSMGLKTGKGKVPSFLAGRATLNLAISWDILICSSTNQPWY